MMIGHGTRNPGSNGPRIGNTPPPVKGVAVKEKVGEKKMAERKSLSIPIALNTDELQLKLRTIAKHAEALADELERIDKETNVDEHKQTL